MINKNDLVGLDITEAAHKLGHWYVLTHSSLGEEMRGEYRFFRSGASETLILYTKDNIVVKTN